MWAHLCKRGFETSSCKRGLSTITTPEKEVLILRYHIPTRDRSGNVSRPFQSQHTSKQHRTKFSDISSNKCEKPRKTTR